MDSAPDSKLKIAIACGGTGGHIFPGLATARELLDRGHDVTLWLAGKGIENPALADWEGRVITVPSEGFQFGLLRSVLTAAKILRAAARCRAIMRREKPDILLAMGSYASVGPCAAAKLLGVPYILHEANARPGRAIMLFARGAAAVAICFEASRHWLQKCNVVLTGMPLRSEFRMLDRECPISKNGFHLLVMGGSGGAHALNETVSEAICNWGQSLNSDKTADVRIQGLTPQVYITHLTGFQDLEAVCERYREAGVEAEVYEFVQDMAPFYQRTDFAICRAGASTCAELTAFGIPALLVPYPHAVADHQTANARALEKQGAADLIQQADLTPEWLADYFGEQIAHPGRLSMPSPTASAAAALAELIERCAKK